MATKRRYYRADRGLPFVELDYDGQDDDTDEGMTESNVRTGFWAVLAVLTFGMALSIAQTVYTPSDIGGSYRVVSVSKGRLHAEDTSTGKRVSFPDQELVKAAFSGKIKRGDVIRS
ncbi:hypothetical protein EDM52_24000 [Brevibacillus invocatus]|uniref:Uncharacterized protein n=1 Tax=Brevibacillus invocatus TaxID=173959 RepID=A0A3M8BMC8_9BACL|nr:hypothetical protein [Brevibacillus invocatus]RNB64582.1 hypothetical protein EDM52_24000 [Brevibacillus invocatus]